jgi:hypothetical protein
MTKTVSKKAATKKEVGHFTIKLYSDDSVTVDVDSPTDDLITALASVITSSDLPGALIRSALNVAIIDLKDSKKKKTISSKKK